MKDQENFIKVSVVTTSGSYPGEDFVEIPLHQKIKIVLQKAAKELNIVSTDKWKAKVNGNVINPESTFLENNFTEEITIDYGPIEGGGGI
ncbi:hypothetical protein G3I01_06380 [Gramella sp. MT6]|uniref:hypothetical protein n=1 Tax=Gramella sp. MT6 TaxID=2705471 RepID=UPI001C5FE5C2|nr:hypothetical protein [Gramella sp. MT6]QYA25153.1 hypothetical protein G3I01_06380 [Gramella sp. MT6]